MLAQAVVVATTRCFAMASLCLTRGFISCRPTNARTWIPVAANAVGHQVRGNRRPAAGRNQYEEVGDILADEFRRMQILPPRREQAKAGVKIKEMSMGPRFKRMSVDQDWPSVWPAARSFQPSTVPLPVHMSHDNPTAKVPRASLGKFNNPELMKIPNFLHLGPPAVRRHCQALRKFCTRWPAELDSDAVIEQHFPVEVKTSNFIWASPSIREPRSRIVNLKIRLSRLPLDDHARDKLKRLVANRYDKKTDTVTFTASACPLRQQNYEYAQYLLTAVFFEAWKTEDWEETEKAEEDWERYYWDKSQSRRTIVDYFKRVDPSVGEDSLVNSDRVRAYADAVSKYMDEGETRENLDNYKQRVVDMMFG